jgi:hypothetical protein
MQRVHADLLARFPFPAVIDNSMYELWKTCPHKFFRAIVQGLKPAQRDPESGALRTPSNIHLHFGGALARGLEVTRKAFLNGDGQGEAIDTGAEALMHFWGQETFPDPLTRNEANKTINNCLLAHNDYFRHFSLDDPLHAIPSAEHVEVSGAAPIPSITHPTTSEPILYAGRFDAICSRYGALFGLDDKTTGSNVESAAWQSQWTLAGQFTGYTWLAETWGFRLSGFLIHGIQILTSSMKFAECATPRTPFHVSRWLAQLQFDVREMILQYNAFLAHCSTTGVFDVAPHPFGQRLGGACHHYNRPCGFLDDICNQPNPEDWIDNAFVVERWNPLQRDAD